MFAIQAATRFDDLMLTHDKLFVVLIVVLVIWFGIVYFLYRNDRKLDRLERMLKKQTEREW